MYRIIIILLIPVITLGVTFAVVSDQTHFTGPDYDTDAYFSGVLKQVEKYDPDFMVVLGDMDRFKNTKWTIEKYLGNITWYPVCGNHDAAGYGVEAYEGENEADFKAFNPNGNFLPGISFLGPENCRETMYGFNIDHVHFVNMNVYFRGTDNQDVWYGAIVDPIYNWLVSDLNANNKDLVFVFGHEMAYNFPDIDNGRMRHEDDLNYLARNKPARDRFWNLLKEKYVTIYFCGHSHSVSVQNINGVWQVNTGHAMGAGDVEGPSTFFIVDVAGDKTKIRVYRDEHDGVYDYDDIYHEFVINTNKPVPVELSRFKVYTINNYENVVLEWETATETNNWGFNIYSAPTDDGPWLLINPLIIPGSGTTLNFHDYEYKVKNNGNLYYRLEQLDTDGKRTNCGTAILEKQSTEPYLAAYPNPFNGSVKIRYFDLDVETRDNQIDIFNINGKLVDRLNVFNNFSNNDFVWKPGASIPTGVYFFKANNVITKCYYIK